MPTTSDSPPLFADIDWHGRTVRHEYVWAGVATSRHPAVVFLHEGLGSVSLWRDFPERFCQAHGLRGLVFSRYGYGRSTARPLDEPLPHDFMHAQAWEVLPALLAQLDIARPWLFGHSDGASIALLHAARYPVSGVVVMAPHILVEDIGVAAIGQAREAYTHGPLRERLARHHRDVDSAFRGWNDVWLDPAFRSWDIRDEVARITAPLLAIQGDGDEYGTLEQVYGIRRLLPRAEVLVLPDCGHSPHRDGAQRVIDEAGRFILAHA